VFCENDLLEIAKGAKSAINVAEILMNLGPDGKREVA